MLVPRTQLALSSWKPQCECLGGLRPAVVLPGEIVMSWGGGRSVEGRGRGRLWEGVGVEKPHTGPFPQLSSAATSSLPRGS